MELRAAAQGGGRAGEEDRARTLVEHRVGGGAADEEPGHAAHPPALLEGRGLGLQNARRHEGPGIEDDEIGRAHVLRNGCEQRLDGILVGRIARIGLRRLTDIRRDRRECLLTAPDQRDLHTVGNASPGQRRAKSRSDADDDSGSVRAHDGPPHVAFVVGTDRSVGVRRPRR